MSDDSDEYENLLLHKYRNAAAHNNRKKGGKNSRKYAKKKSSMRFDQLDSKSEIYARKRPCPPPAPPGYNPVFMPSHPTGDPYCYVPVYYMPTNFLQPNMNPMNPYYPSPFMPSLKGRKRATKSKSMVTLVPSCLSQDQFEHFYTPPDLELSPSYEELLNEAHVKDENRFLDLNIPDNLSFFYNKDFTSRSTLNTEVRTPKTLFKKSADPALSRLKQPEEYHKGFQGTERVILEEEEFPKQYRQFLDEYKQYDLLRDYQLMSSAGCNLDPQNRLGTKDPPREACVQNAQIGASKKDGMGRSNEGCSGLPEECIEFLRKCSELSKDSKQFPIDCKKDDPQAVPKSIMKQPRNDQVLADYKEFRRNFQNEFKRDYAPVPVIPNDPMRDFKQYMKDLAPRDEVKLKETACLTEHSDCKTSGCQTGANPKIGSKNVQTHLRDITKMLLLLPYEDKDKDKSVKSADDSKSRAFKDLFADKAKMKPKSPYHILSPPMTPQEGHYRKFPPVISRSHTPEPVLSKRRPSSPAGKKTVTLVSNKDMLYSKVNKK